METWKSVIGRDGYYEVSDAGRVRRVALGLSRRLLVQTNKKGYRRVTLPLGGAKKAYYVHVLVLTAFTGPCPPGHECRHLNGVRHDNSLSNLAWGTRKENAEDLRLHLKIRSMDLAGISVETIAAELALTPDFVLRVARRAYGENHGRAKLTSADVGDILKRLQNGEYKTSIAAAFKVSPRVIYDIAEGRTWNHLRPIS